MTDQVDEVLAEILGLALARAVAPGENLRRVDEPKWDSLKHIEIIFAVEGAFGVSFSPDEMAAVGAAADLRAKVLAAHAP